MESCENSKDKSEQLRAVSNNFCKQIFTGGFNNLNDDYSVF